MTVIILAICFGLVVGYAVWLQNPAKKPKDHHLNVFPMHKRFPYGLGFGLCFGGFFFFLAGGEYFAAAIIAIIGGIFDWLYDQQWKEHQRKYRESNGSHS